MSTFLTILMWAGIVIGGVLALGVLTLIGFVVWTMFTGSSPKGVEIEVEAPALIGVDDTFQIAVSVRNQLDQPRVLRSLDFDNSLLRGFVVKKIEPNSRESTSGSGTTAHYFDLPIPPRAGVRLVVFCHAVEKGDHSGDVMVFVDQRHWKYVGKQTRLVIR